MSRNVRVGVLAFVLIFLIFSAAAPAFALPPEKEAILNQLFADSLEVLPETQSAYKNRLNKAYAEDPYAFLVCINTQNEEIFGIASFFWLVGKSTEELDAITEKIYAYPNAAFSRIEEAVANMRHLSDVYAAISKFARSFVSFFSNLPLLSSFAMVSA